MLVLAIVIGPFEYDYEHRFAQHEHERTFDIFKELTTQDTSPTARRRNAPPPPAGDRLRTGRRYTSRFSTLGARSMMKRKRGSTSLPISV